MGIQMGPVQGTLELLVLQALAEGREMHGFGILEWLRAKTGDVLVVEDGALYHALHRMQRRAWLECDWGISEKGRRAKYYRLTAQGEAARREEQARWERYVDAVAKIAPQGG